MSWPRRPPWHSYFRTAGRWETLLALGFVGLCLILGGAIAVAPDRVAEDLVALWMWVSR